MLYFSVSYKEKNHHFLLRQFQIRNGIKRNRDFWIPKIERNMQRDREVNKQLEAMGFTVFRFWASEIKTDLKTCINDIMIYLDIGDIHI